MESISQMARRIRENKTVTTPSQSQQYLVSTPTADTTDTPTDNGGLLGGIGYLGQKVGLGFLQGVEGIWDFAAGGIASIFGNQEWAEQQMATDWTNYSSADEWYNPSEGWKFAGDVAGGIGTSLPGVATVTAAALISGGTLAPAAASAIGAGTAFLSAGGTGVKEAYQETGKLDGAAWGYGALTGGLEAAAEYITAGLFPSGSGRVINAIAQDSAEEVAKAGAREISQTLASSGYKKIIGTIWEDFRNEAIEEGLSEIMSPVFKRMTYDQNAEFATPYEVFYASVVGGLSGVVMGGTAQGIDQGKNLFAGSRVVKNGTTEQVIQNAERLARFEAENSTGYELFEQIREEYESLRAGEGKSGKLNELNRTRLLGSLQRKTAAAPFMPFVERSAISYLVNAEAIAAKYNELGITDNEGKPLTFTAEQIRSGVDMSLRETNPKEFTKQLRKALSENTVLSTLAIADATGNIMTDTRRMTEAVFSGEYKADRADLATLLEQGKQEEIEALETALGIDDLSTVGIDEFNSRLADYNKSNGTSEFREQAKRIRQAIEAPIESAKPLPKRVTRTSKDGLYRFKSDDSRVDMALFKDGDTYRIYDYEGRNISKALTLTEVNRILRDFWNSSGTVAPTVEGAETSRHSAKLTEIHKLAMESIPEYKSLSAPNQRIVRDVIRQGRAAGLSEADVMMYARVSAHAGVKVTFDKSKAALKEKGTDKIIGYSDGYYSSETTEIVVNPEGTRSAAQLLIHELTHAIAKSPDGMLMLASESKKLPESEIARITLNYLKVFTGNEVTDSTILLDEANAHYAEALLSDPQILEMLLTKKPTLKEKIISFFKGAKDAYSGWGKLSSATKTLFNKYKKLFDAFSERNQGTLFIENWGDGFIWQTQKPATVTTTDNEEEGEKTTTEVAESTEDTTATGDDKRFAVSDSVIPFSQRTSEQIALYRKRLDAWDGKTEGFSFVMGDTPEYLANLEVMGRKIGKKQVRIDATKIKSIMADHPEMTIDVIKNLPYLLNAPILVLDSKTVPGRLVLFGEVYAKGKPVMMAIEINPSTRRGTSTYVDVIKIASAYTRSNTQNLINNSNIRYIEQNKNRVDEWLKVNRLQLPLPNHHTNPATDSIPETTEKINPSDEISSEISSGVRHALPETDSEGVELTSQQREYFEGTKVVDDEGRLLRVYHGTRKADFTQFKRNFIYFTDSREMADSYAPSGEMYSGYVKITNPFIIDAHGDKWSGIPITADMKNLLENYGSSTFMERGKWRTSVADIVSAVDSMVEDGDADYDGVIVLNVEDTGSYFKAEEHIVANDYIAFSSNQFKNADNKAPTADPDIRFALPEGEVIDNTGESGYNYTQEQYESFGWAREAGGITSSELDDLFSKIQARMSLRTFRRSSRGEAIIEVNNDPHKSLGVDNVFVFVKGSKDNFTITRTVRFNVETETEMEILKEKLYERGTCSDTYLALYQKEGLTREYRREDSPTFATYRKGRSNGETSRRTNKNNRRSGKYGSGYSLSVGENGETIETFADGTVKRYSLPFDWEWGMDEFTTVEDTGDNLGDLYIAPQEEVDAFKESYDEEAILEAGPPIPPGKTPNTRGEVRKIIANHTHDRVYSKKETLALMRKFMDRNGKGQITEKTIGELADSVWQGLNSCTNAEERRTFVEDMSRFIVATITSTVKTAKDGVDGEYDLFRQRLLGFQVGIGRLRFTESDLAELRHRLDKGTAYRRFLGRWGYKGKGHPYYVESFVWDTSREVVGLSDLAETHYMDAILEIDRMLDEAKSYLEDWDYAYDYEDAFYMVEDLEKALYDAFENGGEQSKFSKLVEERIATYRRGAEFWKSEYEGIKGRDKAIGRVLTQAQKLKDLKLGTFLNATQDKDAAEMFKKTIGSLARIQYRNNLNGNVQGVRKLVADLLAWYNPSNPMFKGDDDKPNSLYDKSVADMMKAIATNEHEGFDVKELETLEKILTYFVHMVENFNKVYRNGKWVDALPIAQRYVDIAKKNGELKVGVLNRLFRDGILHKYMQTFGDPEALVRFMDKYERGFFTEIFEELREATIKAQIAEMEARADYDAFMKKHRTYLADSASEKVTYRGKEISRMQLMSLYMTMKRDHARRGLVLSGYAYLDENGASVRVDGLSVDNNIDSDTIDALIDEQMNVIEGMLTDTDRAYIAILEKVFNVTARNMKAARDMERLGFTNVSEAYYYPLRRGNMAKSIDTGFYAEMDRVSNASFNKDTVKGASQELFIESADAVFNRHLSAVCKYAYLSPVIENYDRLFNLDVSGNPNKPVSVATVSGEAGQWNEGNKYFKKLIADIQGIPSGERIEWLGRLRGGYAKFQLGANPKVWVTQLSSLFSASSMLDMDCILRGMTVDAKGVDDYCPIAKLRNQENTVAKSQGILDKIDGFSSILMAPIGKVDRFVICRLFGACQAQVEKNGGAKIGTDENRTEAGKLLEKVILSTQQNVFATERSAAMRSNSEIYRTFTMFTADAVKVVGRVLDAFGELSTLKAKIKAETDPDIKKDLEARLKTVKQKARKSLGAMILSAVFMAAIAQLFRWLYNKDQEESVAETMTVDAVGNMLGGLPVVKDAYAYFTQGYELENYAYSSINDLISSISSLSSTTGSILSGEASGQDIARGLKNLANSVGQVTGLPTRNVYNVIYGLTKRISPATAYKVFDNTFFEQNYKSDFYKAIEDGDGEMAEMLLSMLYEERIGESLSKTLHSELYSMSQKGHKVLPKSVPSSITYGGELVELTTEMQRNITSAYSTFKPKLEKLFARAEYSRLDDEQRAKAVNYVYDLAYASAVEQTLGLDMGNRVLLDKLLGTDTLALFYTMRSGFESDKDEQGRTISGSKRKKVIAQINKLAISKEQKLLLICASGYSIKDGDIKGISASVAKKYLLKCVLGQKSLSKEEKAELATLCGFEVKNGKIVTKTAF